MLLYEVSGGTAEEATASATVLSPSPPFPSPPSSDVPVLVSSVSVSADAGDLPRTLSSDDDVRCIVGTSSGRSVKRWRMVMFLKSIAEGPSGKLARNSASVISFFARFPFQGAEERKNKKKRYNLIRESRGLVAKPMGGLKAPLRSIAKGNIRKHACICERTHARAGVGRRELSVYI